MSTNKSLERIEHALARAVITSAPKLPSAVLRPLSRVADGATLHPELAVFLALQKMLGAVQLTGPDVVLARKQARRDARVHAGPPIPVGAVRDLTYPGAAGPLAARHYAPVQGAGAPLLLYIHGGGFAIGDIETHDPPCRALCAYGNIHVLSVDYRLSPEHVFPAALEDIRAALRFAREQAASLGADPQRIAIGGDSAGGNLATVATQLAKQAGEPLPALQLLIYPVVDTSRDSDSVHAFAEGLLLTRADIHWFREQYVGDADRHDPRISPLLARDLSGLPKAIVISAGFDPLRDEAEAYARALEVAGNQVMLRRFPQLIHGFINFAAVSPASRAALLEIAQLVRRHFAR